MTTISTITIKRRICIVLFILQPIFLNGQILKTGPLYQPDWYEKINQDHFHPAIMQKCILHYTNLERIKDHLSPLTFDTLLSHSAGTHCKFMAAYQILSHRSVFFDDSCLNSRLKTAIPKKPSYTIAENLGVDFILAIGNGVPYFRRETGNKTILINSQNGKPIEKQTYAEFAANMVRLWMESEGHRANILNPAFSRMGAGTILGTYKNKDAVYVTQHFWGEIPSRQDTVFISQPDYRPEPPVIHVRRPGLKR